LGHQNCTEPTTHKSQRRRVADLAVKSRLLAISRDLEFVEDGGFMSYGASIPDLFRRTRTYVDKILKGAKPADLYRATD